MTDERRYGEDEVAEILDRATSPEYDLSQLPRRTGLTLAQIQEIGTEAGISLERIERAALSLARGEAPAAASHTLLGAPRSVERTVHLDRALSDEEWSRLVADLRETFEAEGKLEAHGTLRSWTNGNLKVHLEPAETGYRIRMKTLHSDSQGLFWGGLSAIATAVLIGLLVALVPPAGRDPTGLAVLAGALGVGGTGMIGYARAMLPKWAAERDAQFEGVASRIPLLLER